MKKYQYLIIGGGPSGTFATQAIRSRDQAGSIGIIDDQGERLYSKVILHQFITGEIEKEKLYLESPQWYQENKIELLSAKVEGINLEEKTVLLPGGEAISFEKLLLALGGTPRKLNVEGENLAGISNLYSLSDAEKIKNELEKAKKIVIIGGGFLTIDIVSALARAGKEVTVVARTQRILQEKIGPKGSEIVEKIMAGESVKFEFNASVERFEGRTAVEKVVLTSGKILAADMVITAVGIVPNISLAQASGLKVGKGIIVDQKQESSEKDVYAAGDLCEVARNNLPESFMPGNWHFALSSGRTAGLNMTGANEQNDDLPLVSKVLPNLKLGFVGFINEKYFADEFCSENKYICSYKNDDYLVGLSTINLSQPVFELKKFLGQKYDKELILGFLRSGRD